jgi:hypothetical protein
MKTRSLNDRRKRDRRVRKKNFLNPILDRRTGKNRSGIDRRKDDKKR